MTGITPTTPATFYDWNDEPMSVPIITLSAWEIGIRSIAEHGIDPTPGQNLEVIVRKALGVPDGLKVTEHGDGSKQRVIDVMSWHLTEAYHATKEHYGIG